MVSGIGIISLDFFLSPFICLAFSDLHLHKDEANTVMYKAFLCDDQIKCSKIRDNLVMYELNKKYNFPLNNTYPYIRVS